MSIDPLDLFQNIRIRRTEFIAICLTGMNPLEGIVFQCLGETLGNGAVENGWIAAIS